MTAVATDSPTHPRLWLLAVALTFAAGLLLLSRHNGFATGVHPDEPGKVKQVLQGGYNFFHPQLLLRAGEAASFAGRPSKRAYKAMPEPEREAARRRMLLAGRWASAAMGAAAAALLAWAAWLARRRALEALVTGGVVLLCPTLLVAGHFMKEDTALLLGVAAWTLAAGAFVRTPGRRAAVWLGLAGGLAASGKWVGVVLPLAALPLVVGMLGVRRRRAWADAGLCLALTLALTLLVNHPILGHFDELRSGLATEIDHVADSHWGIVQNAPRVYLRQLRDDAGWGVLSLAGVEVVAAVVLMLRRRGEKRRRAAARLVAPGVALLFLAVLCAAKIAFPRYGLPAVALLYATAAAGAVTVGLLAADAAKSRPRLARVLAPAVALLLLAPTAVQRVADARTLLGHFAHDGRDDLWAWAGANLPPGSRVLAEKYSVLPGDVPPTLDVTVKKRPFFFNDAVDWAADGYAYVAVCDLWYGRYFDDAFAPTPDLRDDVERMRGRYRDLFDGRSGTLVFATDPAEPRAEFVDPAVRLYRLNP